MFTSYADIINFVQEDFEAVNQTIRDNLNSDVALINTLAEYVIASGGKRLRPILTILAGKAVSDKPNPKLPIAAAVVEYIHTATLIHDDVVDHSDQRRGKETANNVWGNEAAVLVGDFLYSRAFQLMQKLDSLPIQNIFADATNRIAEGEVMQLLNIGNINLSEGDYFDIIEAKTAVLFSAACKVGAMVNGGSEKQIHALGEYGKHLGIAFQLMDDILDYEGDSEKLGKNIGDDLSEGKLTLPIIETIKELKNSEKNNQFCSIITSAQEDCLSQKEIDLIKATVRSCGAIEYCKEKLNGYNETVGTLLNNTSNAASIALDQLIDINTKRQA